MLANAIKMPPLFISSKTARAPRYFLNSTPQPFLGYYIFPPPAEMSVHKVLRDLFFFVKVSVSMEIQAQKRYKLHNVAGRVITAGNNQGFCP